VYETHTEPGASNCTGRRHGMSARNQLSPKQKQRNLENIAYVRSLLKQKQDQNNGTQTRTEHQTLEDSQETGPGEG